ncbi:MAG: hypothetical protein KAZ38_20195, partial [Caldilineaceae bacterium]|nr:hypothetical protein [Caldilineaceae bacterium]
WTECYLNHPLYSIRSQKSTKSRVNPSSKIVRFWHHAIVQSYRVGAMKDVVNNCIDQHDGENRRCGF